MSRTARALRAYHWIRLWVPPVVAGAYCLGTLWIYCHGNPVRMAVGILGSLLLSVAFRWGQTAMSAPVRTPHTVLPAGLWTL